MGLIPDQNQKVVVTRGFLTGMAAWPVMLVGILNLESGSLPAWVGWTFSLAGFGTMAWSFPHFFTKPVPFDEERPERQA